MLALHVYLIDILLAHVEIIKEFKHGVAGRQTL